ncbi:FtsQ-type POTRA domain-containing protein [Pelagibacterales bacterium SAG-MED20]|nr:FtsQ-type POTRA domain-containing protein [Pelagibacterales bacterium SAG-MED20]
MLQLIDKKNTIVIYLIFLLILSTTSNKALLNKKEFSTKIDQIDVVGLSKDTKLKILKKLDIFFYENIFFIGKEEIDKIISEYNIIEEYNIKKIYPSKLNIEIKPTKFIAKMSTNNKLFVGANGKIIKSEIYKNSLPYMFGKFDSKKFLEFKKNVEDSSFNFSDFRSISFFPSNRWDILTNDDILIKLPEKNLLNSLDLAYKIIASDQFKGKERIDLRVVNNLIIK